MAENIAKILPKYLGRFSALVISIDFGGQGSLVQIPWPFFLHFIPLSIPHLFQKVFVADA